MKAEQPFGSDDGTKYNLRARRELNFTHHSQQVRIETRSLISGFLNLPRPCPELQEQ